jgi:metal-dependent amidase/aminoacylase/carboxypeptidase family protein
VIDEVGTMTIPFLAEAEALADRLVAIRRDLHMHPELGFQEYRTAGIVADALNALGYEVTTGVGRTGVVGLDGRPATGRSYGAAALRYGRAADRRG